MVELIIRALGLGVGLAMDAFSVSMSNGLKNKQMSFKRALIIALTFAIFQGIMPYLGYLLGHAILASIFKIIPYVALFLLSFLGIKMIIEACKNKKEEDKQETKDFTFKVLLIQAIATSLDALATGLTFSNYSYLESLFVVLIIALVTLIICLIGVYIGKKFGLILKNKADIFGGIILIIIGLEIFIKGII